MPEKEHKLPLLQILKVLKSQELLNDSLSLLSILSPKTNITGKIDVKYKKYLIFYVYTYRIFRISAKNSTLEK